MNYVIANTSYASVHLFLLTMVNNWTINERREKKNYMPMRNQNEISIEI